MSYELSPSILWGQMEEEGSWTLLLQKTENKKPGWGACSSVAEHLLNMLDPAWVYHISSTKKEKKKIWH